MQWRSSLVAEGVKDPVLSLPWHRFDPWPGNFCMLKARPKKKNERKQHHTLYLARRKRRSCRHQLSKCCWHCRHLDGIGMFLGRTPPALLHLRQGLRPQQHCLCPMVCISGEKGSQSGVRVLDQITLTLCLPEASDCPTLASWSVK